MEVESLEPLLADAELGEAEGGGAEADGEELQPRSTTLTPPLQPHSALPGRVTRLDRLLREAVPTTVTNAHSSTATCLRGSVPVFLDLLFEETVSRPVSAVVVVYVFLHYLLLLLSSWTGLSPSCPELPLRQVSSSAGTAETVVCVLAMVATGAAVYPENAGGWLSTLRLLQLAWCAPR